MQYTSLPDGFTIQELDASHLEQFNALLRYAFQVTEEELVQVGWQEDEIKQSKFPILESAHVLGCFEGKTLAAQIAAVSPFRQRSEPAFFSALCSCMQPTGKNGASASRLYAHTRPMRNTVAN